MWHPVSGRCAINDVECGPISVCRGDGKGAGLSIIAIYILQLGDPILGKSEVLGTTGLLLQRHPRPGSWAEGDPSLKCLVSGPA